MAGPRTAIKAGAAYVEAYLDDNRLTRGLKRAQAKLRAFGAGATRIGRRMLMASAAMGGALFGAAKVFSSMGDSLDKMSRRTGMSVEALSELGFAAGRSGTSIESVEKAVKRMQRTIYDADRGLSTAVDGFQDIGIAAEDLKGLSPEDQFTLIADRLGSVADASRRAALAQVIFGRAGTELLPMLEDGADGMSKLRKKARDLGLTLSTEDAKAAAEFTDIMGDMWATIKRATFAIGAALGPVLGKVADRITKVFVSVRKFIDENRGLVVSILKVTAIVAAVGSIFMTVGLAASMLAFGIGGIISMFVALKAAVVVAAGVLMAILSPIGLVVAAVVGLGAYILHATGAGAKALKWLGGVFGRLKDDALVAFGGIRDALAAGDIKLAAKILWLTLKKWWTQGVKWLTEIWGTVRLAMIDVFYGVVDALAVAWGKLREGWLALTAILLSAWLSLTTGIKLAWSAVQTWLAKKIVESTKGLRKILDVLKYIPATAIQARIGLKLLPDLEGIDTADVTKSLEDRGKREHAAAMKLHNERMAALDKEEIRKFLAIREETKAVLAAIKEEYAAAAAADKKRLARQLVNAQKAVDEATGQHKKALAKAAEARRLAEKKAAEDRLIAEVDAFMRGKDKKVGDKAGAGLAAAAGVVRGSFSAAAIRGFGGGGRAVDRIADATEETAKQTKRTVKKLGEVGKAFT